MFIEIFLTHAVWQPPLILARSCQKLWVMQHASANVGCERYPSLRKEPRIVDSPCLLRHPNFMDPDRQNIIFHSGHSPLLRIEDDPLRHWTYHWCYHHPTCCPQSQKCVQGMHRFHHWKVVTDFLPYLLALAINVMDSSATRFATRHAREGVNAL